jgi:nucleotide-binding universal stress UspA family protein
MTPSDSVAAKAPPVGRTWMVGNDHRAPVIIAALDGSAPSRCTTALAAGLIRRMGWRLALVPVPLTASDADRRSRLVAAALDEQAALIAIPATDHRSSGGAAAACLALAACAPCPVLAVPLARGTEPALNGPLICGIDGADSSAPIARAAARLAVALNAGLELVHVAAPRENGAVAHAGLPGPFSGRMWRALHSLEALPPVTTVVESGDPTGRLCSLAESEGALLVIGAPASGEAEGEGRVAATILTESHVPVAVVSGGHGTVSAAAGVPLNALAA